MTTLKYERDGETFTVDANSLPAESIAYLLQYGFAQSLQDCIAGRAKATEAEIREAIAKGEYHGDASEEGIAKAVRDDVMARLYKRRDAIAQGTVNVRTAGEPRDPLRAIARDMVLAAIRTKYGKAKVTKDKLDELTTKFITERRDAVQAEYDRRRSSIGDVDFEV